MSTIIGIYIITNKIDDRVYIGSSVNYSKRIKEHKNHLLKNKHHNIHLQRFVDKYGILNLDFKIIEECDKEVLLLREEFWFNKFNNKFNIAKSPSAPMLGRTHSNEYKEKRSRMMKGINNITYGTKRPDHVKTAISEANKNNKLTINQRLKQIQNIVNKKKIKVITLNNENFTFDSISDASKYLKVTYQSVSKALKNKRMCRDHIIISADCAENDDDNLRTTTKVYGKFCCKISFLHYIVLLLLLLR